MTVSICIPIFGVEHSIERCSRSLFSQTYTNIEYIFVNDCTKDKSMEILSKVIVEYPNRISAIRIISHKKNRGLAAARNTAIENCTGDFVMHVDSDDYLESTHFEAMHNAIGDEDLVVCDYRTVTEDGSIIKPQILPEDFPAKFTRDEALEDMGRGTSIWGYVWNKLFNTLSRLFEDGKITFR